LTELLEKAILAICEALVKVAGEKYHISIRGELYPALESLLEARRQSLRD
jgi:hypothetical protein